MPDILRILQRSPRRKDDTHYPTGITENGMFFFCISCAVPISIMGRNMEFFFYCHGNI